MAAAAGVDRNFAQAFWTLLGGRIGWYLGFPRPSDQGVDRSNDEEVDRGRNQQKADPGGDEITNRKYRASNRERDPGKVRLAHDESDDGINEVLNQGSHDSPKRRADHYAHRQINYIAAQNELLK